MLSEQTIEVGTQPGNAPSTSQGEQNAAHSHEHSHHAQHGAHQGCQHGKCSHNHGSEKGRSWLQLFRQYDSSTRAFMYYHIISGNLFFRLVMGLPFFPQMYQAYYMAKTMLIDQPLNLFLGFSIQLLSRTNINRNIKQLLGGFLLPLLCLNIFLFYTVIINVLPHLYSRHLIEPLIFGSLFMNVIFFMTVYFSNPGFLNNPENKKKFAYFKEIRPELSTPKFMCYECGEPRIIRSFHCPMCNSCVTKWEIHSQLFNKCIGAGNQVLFLIFLGFYSFLLFLLFLTFFMKKMGSYHLSLSCGIGFVVAFFLFFGYLKEFLIQLIMVAHNLTSYEIMNFGRIPYLWKSKRRDFFNPFDRGFAWNFREAFEPFMALARQENKKPPSSDIEESSSGKDSLDTSFPVSLINWVDIKLFTILDIPISPFREFVIDEMVRGKVPLPVGASFNPQTRTLHFSKEYVKMIEEKKEEHGHQHGQEHGHQHGPGCSHGHGHQHGNAQARPNQESSARREEVAGLQREQERQQAEFQRRMMSLQQGMNAGFPGNPVHQPVVEKPRPSRDSSRAEEEESKQLLQENTQEEQAKVQTEEPVREEESQREEEEKFIMQSAEESVERKEERPLLQQDSLGEDDKNPFH